MNLPKIIVVCGPTATGKSDLAVTIAKKFGGEVISADSRQVYEGLDIGSGKITKSEMKGVPHHLLDIVSPKKVFTVADFKKLATRAITDILSRENIPIICGGTGFYIQSLVDNTTLPEVAPNTELRKRLQELDLKKLFTKLKNLDPERAKTIDPDNKVRLIRAIEIAIELGQVPRLEALPPSYKVLQIGLDIEDAELKERIDVRLEKRLSGIITEVKKLHAGGLSWKRMESLGLEYKYGAQFAQKKISKEEMIEKLNMENWHYVKRQRTWFRKDKRVKWYDPTDVKAIEKEVKKFLKV